MPLNPNIPLSVQQAQPFNALLAGHQARQQQVQGEKRNKLLDLQTSGQQMNNDRAAAEDDIRSAYKGPLDLVNILGQEGEVTPQALQSAQGYMQSRINEIEGRGGNSEGSRRALALLQTGGIEELRQAPSKIQDTMIKTGMLKAPQQPKDTRTNDIKNFEFAQSQGFEGSFNDFVNSGGTGLAIDDSIGTPVRVERDGKTFLAVMVQTPDGGFEAREVGINGELTDTSGRTAGEQVIDKGRTEAVKRAVVQSDKAFEKLESINTNIANLEEGINLIQNEGASTGVIADLLPTVRSSSIKLKNLQSRLGLDIIGAVTFGALSKGELDLALSTALPGKLPENELIQFLTEKRNAQVKLRDQITEFAQFTGAGDKTTAEWLEFKKQQKNTAQPSEAATNLPTGVTEEDVAFTMERHNMTREQVLQQLGAQ